MWILKCALHFSPGFFLVITNSKVDYQPQGRYDKLAIVKDTKADVSSFSPSLE